MATISAELASLMTAGTFTAIPRIFTGRGARGCRGMSSTPIILARSTPLVSIVIYGVMGLEERK
jgi:hypothetical protein